MKFCFVVLCAPTVLSLSVLFISGMLMQKERVQVCTVMKMQVSGACCVPVRAERSRCHEAVFNRISPSLLDVFHDSRAVSHFPGAIIPHIFGSSALLQCGS